MIFDKTKVVPPEYARVLDSNIKFHFLDESGTVLHTIDDSDFNIIISNTQKIIIKKKRKEATPGEVLFGSNSSLLSAVYGGDDSEDDAWDDSTLMDNQRFKSSAVCRSWVCMLTKRIICSVRIWKNKFAPAAQTKPVSATRSTCWLLIPRLLRATTTQVHHM